MALHRRLPVMGEMSLRAPRGRSNPPLADRQVRDRVVASLLAMTVLLCDPILGTTVWASEIQGKILVAEPYPEVKKIPVKKKPHKHFPDEIPSSSLLISAGGGLQNAVVFLQGEFSSPPPPEGSTGILDQRDYQFGPHVLILPAGGALRVANSDPMAHDVRVFDGAKMLIHFEMDPFQEPVERQLPKPGIYVVRCGLHSWMHAFVVHAAHPYYAVSDEEGGFRLTGVPPGDHVLRVWHEILGEAEIPVTVAEDRPADPVTHTFKSA